MDWTQEALLRNQLERDDKWTESLAVGGEAFIENYQKEIGSKAKYRRVAVCDNCHVVRESSKPYSADL